MKKIITILTVLMMAASLFAATDGGTITVKAKATEVSPTFTIKGGVGNYDTAAGGTITLAEADFNVGDSEDDITISIQILQPAKAKFSAKKATITITPTALSATINGANHSTALPDIVDALSMTGTAAASETNTAKKITSSSYSETDKVQKIVLTYPNGTVNATASTAFDVLRTSYKWTGNDELPATPEDTYYVATITLTYETE